MGRIQGNLVDLVGARARFMHAVAAAVGCLFLANCSGENFARQVDPKYGVASSPRVVDEGQPVPKGGGNYRIGKPYQVAGRTYVPEHNPSYTAEGMASWYGADFHGRLTANGEVYDKDAISAAHPTLPLPSYARVTNLSNGRSIIVRVNDRGPYAKDRVIDLSSKAAELLRYKGNGVAQVRVEYAGPASLEGSDDRKLVATLRENQPAPAPSSVMVASNSSFIPQSGRAATGWQGGYAPVPIERPFELGRYAAPSESTEAAPNPRNAPRTGHVPAQSAIYAANPQRMPAQTSPLGFVSGRGLY